MLQTIRCHQCDKVLLEANGEIKKKCPRCKTENHVITTQLGFVVYIDKNLKPSEWHIKQI